MCDPLGSYHVGSDLNIPTKGYNQEEGINYDEKFARIPKLEVIQMLLAFTCVRNSKSFQMDVKNAFLNGYIMEKFFFQQLQSFEDNLYPNHVFKLQKALHGLKQALKAWYERLSNFLIEKGSRRCKVDAILFIKEKEKEILLVQLYVDDIIFGFTNLKLC